MVPTSLKGKEFETLILEAAKREEASGGLTLSRYGVKGITLADKRTILVPSLPDFEGVLAGGRQIILEAKVWSKKSFQIDPMFIKVTQVSHMLTRSRFGVLCYLVIHFTKSSGKTYIDPAITVAIPVTDQFPIWQQFLDAAAAAKAAGEKLGTFASISRDEAQDMGQLVPWRIPKGCRKALPDLLSFLWPEARAAIEIPVAKPTPTRQPDNWD